MSYSQCYRMGNKLTIELLGLLMNYFEMLNRSKEIVNVPVVTTTLPLKADHPNLSLLITL